MSNTFINRLTEEGMEVLLIDNPPLNLLTEKLKDELERNIDRVQNDENIRVLVLTGAGDRAFCAGRDLNETQRWIESGKTSSLVEQAWKKGHTLIEKIQSLSIPTIVAVEGVAFGGGCELLLAFDICIASENAKFGFPEVKRGIFPGTGGVKFLSKRVGIMKARELMYLGNIIDSQEALSIGLISRIVPPGQALNEALNIARNICDHPKLAVQAIKETTNHYLKKREAEAEKFEMLWFKRIFQTHDAKEGISAFFEKREPNFKHR